MEGVVEGDDADLLVAAGLPAPGAGQLDRALARLGAGGQQKDLSSPSGATSASASTAAARISEGKQ